MVYTISSVIVLGKEPLFILRSLHFVNKTLGEICNCFHKNLHFFTSIDDILIKMNTIYKKKPFNHVFMFQRFDVLIFEKLSIYIFLFLHFLITILYGVSFRKSSGKYITSTMLFTCLKLQDNFSCIFLDI